MLDLLRTFATYMECRNTVATGRRLGVSQPAVTAHLQRLEEFFGQPLFLTSGRSKEPTPLARRLAESLGPQLSALDRSIAEIRRQFGSPAELTLRVGCRAEVVHRVARQLQWPGRLVMRTVSSREALDGLTGGELDLAVIPQRPDSADLVARVSFREGSALIVPRGMIGQGGGGPDKVPAWKQWLKTAGTATLPWAVYRPEAPLAAPVFAELGISIAQIHRLTICEDWRAIMQLVNEGRAVSVVPAGFAAEGKDTARGIAVWNLPSSVVPVSDFQAIAPRALLQVAAYKSAWLSLTATQTEPGHSNA
jgi:DNA-binding transcriptional LysR family regulator